MSGRKSRMGNRFLCADLVRVALHSGHEQTAEAGDFREAVLEDICEVGACLQLDEALPAGAAVTVSKGRARLKGVVAYCVWRDSGYFAGIRLSEETRWSSGVFVPEHLTNLRALDSPIAAAQ